MIPDSPTCPLPLNEAVLAWSDPQLIDAIRAEEAKFPPGRLERLDRDPIALLSTRRMQPQRGRSLSLGDNSTRPFDQAWDALVNAFRLAVERGDIELWGLQTEPLRLAHPERLPANAATVFAFDIRGCAVFLGDRIYVPVTASKAAAGVRANAGKAPDQMSACAADLNLADALIRHSPAELVEAVRREERHCITAHVHEFYRLNERLWQLSPDADLAQQGTHYGGKIPVVDHGGLSAAWRALERDFRGRLARHDLHLHGVQTRPERRFHRTEIPGVWAAEFELRYHDDTLAAADYAYVAVMASLTPFEAACGADPQPTKGGLSQPSRVEVADLDPEIVAGLLEKHAEHVRLGLRVELAPPGKASPLALVASKMKHRAMTNEMRRTLAEEARWLSAWVAKVAPSYAKLGEKTIQNKLGHVYRNLVEEFGFSDEIASAGRETG